MLIRGTTTNLPAPDALSLYAIDSVGQIQTLPDLTRSSVLLAVDWQIISTVLILHSFCNRFYTKNV